MQTVIRVVTTGRGSLRNEIIADRQLEKKFKLVPTEHFRAGPHGWAKIHSAREAHGVINLEWHSLHRCVDLPS